MCGDGQTKQTVIDLRVIAPRLRDPMIFSAFEELASGEAVTIINDHDPRQLHCQFVAEYPGIFEWRYDACGPDIWTVRVTRTVA